MPFRDQHYVGPIVSPWLVCGTSTREGQPGVKLLLLLPRESSQSKFILRKVSADTESLSCESESAVGVLCMFLFKIFTLLVLVDSGPKIWGGVGEGV